MLARRPAALHHEMVGALEGVGLGRPMAAHLRRMEVARDVRRLGRAVPEDLAQRGNPPSNDVEEVKLSLHEVVGEHRVERRHVLQRTARLDETEDVGPQRSTDNAHWLARLEAASKETHVGLRGYVEQTRGLGGHDGCLHVGTEAMLLDTTESRPCVDPRVLGREHQRGIARPGEGQRLIQQRRKCPRPRCAGCVATPCTPPTLTRRPASTVSHSRTPTWATRAPHSS